MNKPRTKTETFFQQEATDVQLADFCGGVIAGCSYQSPDKETANEDAAAWIQLSKNHGVLVVADGVGGQSAGDRAARTAIESVVEHCQDSTDETSLRAEILDAIEAANREVLSWGIGAGSTIVVAEYLSGNRSSRTRWRFDRFANQQSRHHQIPFRCPCSRCHGGRDRNVGRV